MLKKLLSLFAGLLLTLGVYAANQSDLRGDHPDTYTVKRGDTLWDISARFLHKPWLWPELWQANPQIQNPHLIYPGDVLSLAYLNGNRASLRNEGGPHVRAESLEDAIKPIPLGELKNFLKNTRILDEETFKHAPHVLAMEENMLRAANGKLIYVKDLNAKSGEQFAIVRPTALYFSIPPEEDGQPRRVYARETESFYDGEPAMLWHHGDDPRKLALFGNVDIIGHEVLVIGQVTVTKSADVSSALVTYSDMEVRKGDLLLPVEDKPYDSAYFPHPPKSVPADMTVINFTDALGSVGPHQVVVLSRGGKDGVDNGQTYSIYQTGDEVTDDYKYPKGSTKAFIHPKKKKSQLPEEFIGHVMVFRTFDNVSYGLVMDGIRPVKKGNLLHAPE